MTVTRYAQVNLQGVALGTHPIHYIVTTTAELPATGLKLGDTALALDTNAQYKASSTTAWTSVLSAGSAQTFTKGVTFADTTAVTPLTFTAWQAPFACTAIALRGRRVGGTGATINAYRLTTGTALRSANLSLTSASTWTDGGALQNTAFAAGDSLLLGLLTVTGSVTEVVIQLNLTVP